MNGRCLVLVDAGGDLATAELSVLVGRGDSREGRGSRINSILDVAVLPVGVTEDGSTETDRIIDAAEADGHLAGLVLLVECRTGTGTYIVRHVLIEDLLDLAIVRGRHENELSHGDIHVHSDGTDDTSRTHREIERHLRTHHIHLGTHLHVDGRSLEADAVGVRVIEGLAGVVLAENNMGVPGGGDFDGLNRSSVDERKNLGRNTPGGGQGLQDNTADACN